MAREPVPPVAQKPRRKRHYSRHGFHGLKRQMVVGGIEALDHRGIAFRELRAWLNNQIQHLGGSSEVTHPEMTLVQRAGVLEALIRQAEADMLSRGVLADSGDQRKPHPLLTDYRGLIKEQREILITLGLKRRAKALTLAEIVELEKAREHEHAHASSPEPPPAAPEPRDDTEPTEPPTIHIALTNDDGSDAA